MSTFTDEQVWAALDGWYERPVDGLGYPPKHTEKMRAALTAAAEAAPAPDQIADAGKMVEPAPPPESASGWSGELRPHLRPDGIPTRCDKQWMSAAELAITEAMYAVERTPGGSYPLTEAVCLLSQARDRVADHMEGRFPASPASEQEG